MKNLRDQAKQSSAQLPGGGAADRPKARRYALATTVSILLMLVLVWLALQTYELRTSSELEAGAHSDPSVSWWLLAGIILVLAAIGAIAFRVTRWSQDSISDLKSAPTTAADRSA